MRSIQQSLGDMALAWMGRFDEQEKQQIEAILEDAKAFVLEALSIADFGRRSTGRMRTMALLVTAKEDPRREALLVAIDALLLFQGFVITTCGVWTPEALNAPSGLGPMRVHSPKQQMPV